MITANCSLTSTRYAGFTLVEMLVVIGIIGILATAIVSSFTNVRRIGWQSHAQHQVAEVATAFNWLLQVERKWPDEIINKTEIDIDVCYFFQMRKWLEVNTYKDLIDKVINLQSLDRFGMLDPWGRMALKRNKTQSGTDKITSGGTYIDHRIQFRLDKNYDGWVDTNDGAPPNVRVRASVIVWSRGPDGVDDFTKSGRYPDDDRLSWAQGFTQREK